MDQPQPSFKTPSLKNPEDIKALFEKHIANIKALEDEKIDDTHAKNYHQCVIDYHQYNRPQSLLCVRSIILKRFNDILVRQKDLWQGHMLFAQTHQLAFTLVPEKMKTLQVDIANYIAMAFYHWCQQKKAEIPHISTNQISSGQHYVVIANNALAESHDASRGYHPDGLFFYFAVSEWPMTCQRLHSWFS
ncbi:MAG: hypothetical protein AAF403_02465, partial [Pseudomonadota bacterium]